MEEDLAKTEALEVPLMKQVIAAYREITASSEFLEIERIRSKARQEEEQILHNARLDEREKWQNIIKDKDALIKDKDALIADNDVLIAELRAQLGESK